jgi:hypothetical protein
MQQSDDHLRTSVRGASSKEGRQAILLTSHLAADATNKSQARLRSLGRYHVPAVIIYGLTADLRMSEIGWTLRCDAAVLHNAATAHMLHQDTCGRKTALLVGSQADVIEGLAACI